MFDDNVYLSRRKGLQQELESGLVLLLGNEEAGMSYADNYYPFRQDSSFLYYGGLDYPGLALVMDLDEGKVTLFGHELTMDDIVWMGPQPSLSERSAQAGINHIEAPDKLEGVLQKAAEKGRRIHFLPPYRPEHDLKLFRWLGVSPGQGKAAASVPLIKAIVNQRSIKGKEEVIEIEKAVTLTGHLHREAMSMARAGMVEWEIAGHLQGLAVGGGGRLSFPAIVTINGQTLHNQYYNNTLEEGRLLLVDAGAESGMHYAGDMTRTFPVGGKFSSRQKDIYAVVLDAQTAAIAALRPGLPYKDVHLLSARVIAEGLKRLGLMKGDPEEAVEAGAHALFFPHGLGHMMGLDVHDMENLGENFVGYASGQSRSTQFGLKSLRLARPLEPGFVLTVEPGIYFIPELIDQWQAEGKYADFLEYEKISTFKDFGGIRIEDDYLITQEGARLLGSPVPKMISEVESLQNS